MDLTRKLILGIFVGSCLALFGAGLFLIGSGLQLFTKSFNIYADFAKITGIEEGGKVRVEGMDAGTVTSIDVPTRPGGRFRIHFRIVEKLHPIVRQDSVASIETDGLLGNNYLQVKAGSEASPLVKADSAIQAKELFEWGDLMVEITGVVRQVDGIMAGVKDQLSSTLAQLEVAGKSTNQLIEGATPQVKSILASADRISANVDEIVAGIQAGQGTVGALVKDKDLYASVKRSADSAEKTVENIRESSASARKIVGQVQESDIVPEMQRTMQNLQLITQQVKDAVDKFQSASAEGGVGENLQRALADAHAAMSDLSDDTEALKHNFLFRSFFNNRGFFDLAALTTPEYKSATFGKGFKRHRIWMDGAALFQPDAKGVETLSAEGKVLLDATMTELLDFPRNGPLMIEGFSGAGTASQQYLAGRRRAVRVEAYLIDRFHLRPAYVGVVSMGAEPLDGKSPGVFKEGVGVVSFYK